MHGATDSGGPSSQVPSGAAPAERPSIRVVVVDDHAIVVQGVLTVLAREPDIDVVGTAGTMAEGVDAVTRMRPAVAVVDYDLADADGLELVRRVSATAPATRLLLFTGYASEHLVVRAVEAGCSGILPKGRPLGQLVDAIRAVAEGKGYLPADVLPRLVAGHRPSRRGDPTALTARELELLALVARGANNQQIAEELVVSVNTVRNHVKNILLKLGAHSKLEAVAVALQQGILSRPH